MTCEYCQMCRQGRRNRKSLDGSVLVAVASWRLRASRIRQEFRREFWASHRLTASDQRWTINDRNVEGKQSLEVSERPAELLRIYPVSWKTATRPLALGFCLLYEPLIRPAKPHVSPKCWGLVKERKKRRKKKVRKGIYLVTISIKREFTHFSSFQLFQDITSSGCFKRKHVKKKLNT